MMGDRMDLVPGTDCTYISNICGSNVASVILQGWYKTPAKLEKKHYAGKNTICKAQISTITFYAGKIPSPIFWQLLK